MPGIQCTVYGCENNTEIKNKVNGETIIFHRFPLPKDVESTTVRSEWINRCRRDKLNPNSVRICSIHSTNNDYERNLQNELLGLPVKRILKKTAVPTLELNYKETEPARNENLTIDYEAKYIEFLEKYNTLKKTSGKKIKALNEQVKYYKDKACKKQQSKNTEMAYTLLNKVLTQNQIDLLSKKKKRVNWTREEIAVAFTLRYYSKKCYLYIRNKLHYPLPALSSLRKWASQINVSQGILKDVLLMLSLAGECFTTIEKTVVLQFDEVKVKAVEEYNVSKDEVLGPFNQMQVVMARGIFSNWKQPVYIAFDQKMTKEILLNIITELHKISYNVVACVSDCGGSNIGLWNELQIDIDNTFFKHPSTNKNIYMFADAPHLLKLVRNWLLDKGFHLEDGSSIINKTPLQALVRLTNTEVNACWKISEKHLNCERSQRQNVRLAAQLLSNTVSTALLRYKPGDDKTMAENN